MSTTMSAAEPATHVAHHFDDAEQQYIAADLGMWVFLATEVLFFGGVFCGYALYRYRFPAEFAAGSHRLDVSLGTINTAVLLTSSLTLALAVHAAQTSRFGALVRNLFFTLLLGAAFLGFKGYEYYHKFEEGLVPGRHFSFVSDHNPPDRSPPAERRRQPQSPSDEKKVLDTRHVQLFFSLYFAMTGLHALHMVIGLGVLAVLVVSAARGAFSANYFTPVEMTGLYWHFVDIVWVFLFPLLYLIR